MIKIEVEFFTGDTYITKGTCRLYICNYSQRRNLSSLQRLLIHRTIFNGRVEFRESRHMVDAFNNLKWHIIAHGREGCGGSFNTQDSVNQIVNGCVARAQEIMGASVLA